MNKLPLHVMYDLETLGTGDHAAVVQLGATGFSPGVRVEPDGRALAAADGAGMIGSPTGGQFNAHVALWDPDIGALDAPTVKWWMGQEQRARERVFYTPEREPLRVVLSRFREWVQGWGDEWELAGLWSAKDFDHRLLRQAHERTGVGWPDRWRKLGRDYPTLRWIGRWQGIEEPPRVGVHHDALDDACHQASYALTVLGEVDYWVGR